MNGVLAPTDCCNQKGEHFSFSVKKKDEVNEHGKVFLAFLRQQLCAKIQQEMISEVYCILKD